MDAHGSSLASTRSPARARILETAYDLFAHRGTQAVGIDAIVDQAGVARQTLYRHFTSKQELVLAFLSLRERVWTKEWLQREVERRATEPDERLLAIFDVFDGWFRTPDFEGCSFINVLLERSDPADPVHRAAAQHLAEIRGFLKALARRARVADPDNFARKWHILMKGSIIAAGEGDREAASRARQVASLVLRAEPRLQR
jgi:AcrR family transcriptional regulator